MWSAFFTGFMVSFGIIGAIGAQNAFVLRQGIRREHVLLICVTCALSDTILMFAGATSFVQITNYAAWVEPLMRYGGAAFLFWYGAKSFWSAYRSRDALIVTTDQAISARSALLVCLALTWLNPHVYLDTVIFIGAIATQFPGNELIFASGASIASVIFFCSLGFGAGYLRGVFANPFAWRCLEAGIGIVMWSIAVGLLVSV